MRQVGVVVYRRYALYLGPYEQNDTPFAGLLSAIYGAHAQTVPSAPQAQTALPLTRGAGRNILVDAGFLKDIPEGKDFEVVHYTRPDSALAKVALKPEDITDIILTHPNLGPY